MYRSEFMLRRQGFGNILEGRFRQQKTKMKKGREGDFGGRHNLKEYKSVDILSQTVEEKRHGMERKPVIKCEAKVRKHHLATGIAIGDCFSPSSTKQKCV